MLIYTLRLFEKYRVRIYPAVIFSYDKPYRAEKSRFEMVFPDLNVLQFQYRVIQLNRLSWKDFVRNLNPVAIALMAKMRIATKDRPYVRLECLRLLATLKLDPARSRLIGGFVETYLRLNAREMQVFEQELATLVPEEKEATMMMTSWERKGLEKGKEIGREEGIEIGRVEGRQQGKEELILRMVQHRFPNVSAETITMLDNLTSIQLDDLGAALFDFTSAADLEHWLGEH